MKLITAVFIPILLMAAIFGSFSSVAPVSADCTYNLNWSFDDSVPSEWQPRDIGQTVSYNGADGHDAIGMMDLLSDGVSNSTAVIYKDDILSSLGMDSSHVVYANDVAVTGWGNPTNADWLRIEILLDTQGVLYSGYHSTADTWGEMSVAGSGSTALLAGVYLVTSHDLGVGMGGGWDDIVISIPCENVQVPGEATPTPVATAVFTPTATPSVSDTIAMITPADSGFVVADFPGPLPIPSIEDTIDFSVFWDMDNFVGILQIVQTFFYLQTIPEFLKVFFFVMSVVIGLRVVVSIVTSRGSSKNEV